MRTLSRDEFDSLVRTAGVKPRLRDDLRFVTSVSSLSEDWTELELVTITDKTSNKGVLLLQPDDELYLASFELSRRIIDSQTGRTRAIICDFCYTWQPGSNAASITFTRAGKKNTITYLCCADLQCSRHVRTLTKAAVVSRSQLRENLTDEERVERLKRKLAQKITQLGLHAVQ